MSSATKKWTKKLWLLMTGDRCSIGGHSSNKSLDWEIIIGEHIYRWWLLFEVTVSSGLTVYVNTGFPFK